MANDRIMKIRLTGEDLEKVQAIANAVTDGNVSRAIRVLIRASKLAVKPITVVECNLTEEALRSEDFVNG